MNKDFRESFSKILMTKFLEKNITQKRLSDLTGISQSNIYNYLHGLCMPKRDAIDKMAEVLDTNFDELMDF